MNKIWPLQEAKNKLSEVVDKALQEGPQSVSRRGVETVVIVSAREYAHLTRGKESLAQFLRQSPLAKLDLSRAKDKPRQVDL